MYHSTKNLTNFKKFRLRTNERSQKRQSDVSGFKDTGAILPKDDPDDVDVLSSESIEQMEQERRELGLDESVTDMILAQENLTITDL